MNVCMVGYGMMGTWHSESLRKQDCVLHTLVGPDTQKAEAFALKYGYRHWHVDYKKAFNDPQIDVVIIAGPSQSHAEMALAALHYGKHVLVEIPLALTLEDCEAIDATAARLGLTVGVVHPMRFRKSISRSVKGFVPVKRSCFRYIPDCTFIVAKIPGQQD